MRDSSRILTLIIKTVVVAMSISVSGCRQKDLLNPEEIHPDETRSIVDVDFLWDNNEKTEVEGMSTYFFPLSPEGKIWNFEIAGMKGGLVALVPGSYTLVAVNNDLPGIDLSTDISASSVTVNARYYDDGTLQPSGMVYGSVVNNVIISADTCQSITVTPDSLATVYNVLLEDISHPDMIESIYACISGVATSLCVDGGSTSTESGSIRIPIAIESGMMSGSTTGLGTPSGSPHFLLTLYAKLTDKRRIARSLTFDITDQIMHAKHPHNVYITLSGIDFDGDGPEMPDDVGMEVDVDGWSSITIDLISGN